MTNEELHMKLSALISRERGITNEILRLIIEAEQRRLYLELGYSSMFDWLVKEFRYSAAAAYRRIQAARLLRDIPKIEQKLKTGEINLTTLARTQTAMRKEEKRIQKKILTKEKVEIIEKVEGKTEAQVEQVLVSLFPNSEFQQERLKVVSTESLKLTVILSSNAVKELERARELLAHVKPGASWADIIAHLAQDFLKRKDPLCKSSKSGRLTRQVSGPVSPRVGSSTRHLVLQRDEGKCQFVEPDSGRKCESRYMVEIDHIKPRGMGGSDDPANLRCLCRKHNILIAERSYGKEFMAKWRSKNS